MCIHVHDRCACLMFTSTHTAAAYILQTKCHIHVCVVVLYPNFVDIDNLQQVFSEVHCLADKWKPLGLTLGLKYSTLSIIQSDHRDVMSCLCEVLAKWLDRVDHTGVPSWEVLVAAVAAPTGGNKPALAQQIAHRYNGEC